MRAATTSVRVHGMETIQLNLARRQKCDGAGKVFSRHGPRRPATARRYGKFNCTSINCVCGLGAVEMCCIESLGLGQKEAFLASQLASNCGL